MRGFLSALLILPSLPLVAGASLPQAPPLPQAPALVKAPSPPPLVASKKAPREAAPEPAPVRNAAPCSSACTCGCQETGECNCNSRSSVAGSSGDCCSGGTCSQVAAPPVLRYYQPIRLVQPQPATYQSVQPQWTWQAPARVPVQRQPAWNQQPVRWSYQPARQVFRGNCSGGG